MDEEFDIPVVKQQKPEQFVIDESKSVQMVNEASKLNESDFGVKVKQIKNNLDLVDDFGEFDNGADVVHKEVKQQSSTTK